MKNHTLAIAITLAMAPALVNAAEEKKSDIDMSNPTDVYTSVGVSYGSEGMNLKGQLMLSETTGDSGQKTGIIFEAKNVFNEGDKSPKFSGTVKHPTYGLVPTFNDEKSERSYRFRFGTINTTNGTGWSVDASIGDHPFYGTMTAVQAGPVMTIPVTDNLYIFPVLYVGGVIVEDNIDMLASSSLGSNAGALGLRSSGVDVASLIMTGMAYARYTINDNWWVLGSARYTGAIQGKNWSDDVLEGGMQMANVEGEISVAYQINSHQNLRMNYKTDDSDDTDDSYWLEYNYAF